MTNSHWRVWYKCRMLVKDPIVMYCHITRHGLIMNMVIEIDG